MNRLLGAGLLFGLVALAAEPTDTRHEGSQADSPASATQGPGLDECRTCAYYEGYVLLWHQGSRLPAEYTKDHTAKSYPDDMKAAMACKDEDREGYCAKRAESETTCAADSWCYWDKNQTPKCDLGLRWKGKLGGPGADKTNYVSLMATRTKCQSLYTPDACKQDEDCHWTEPFSPCVPKAEVLTCTALNQRARISKKECCKAIDGCSWDWWAGTCGPWQATIDSCKLFQSEGARGSAQSTYSALKHPGPYISESEYWRSWDTHVSGTPEYDEKMKDRCRKVSHLFDGHGRQSDSAVEDAASILKSQRHAEEIHVQHWGCSTFENSNEASPFAGVRNQSLMKVGFATGAFTASAAGAPLFKGLAASFLDRQQKGHAALMKDDPVEQFRRIVVPLWKERLRRTGKAPDITLMANQLQAQTKVTAAGGRATNSPFFVGILGKKLVQWPALCAPTVRCETEADRGKRYVCRLPETSSWTLRIAPPSFDDPQAMLKEKVVIRACRWREGEWWTQETLPNFPFVLERYGALSN